jgi:hypothetical protein
VDRSELVFGTVFLIDCGRPPRYTVEDARVTERVVPLWLPSE